MPIRKKTLKAKGKDRKARTAYLVIVEGPRDPVTGKRRQYSKQVPTLEKARDLEASWRADIARGTVLDPDKTTVGELLDEWLAGKTPGVQPQTAAGYEITIRVHLKPALGDVKVQKLSAARVQAQYDAWRAGGMSERTMRECHLRLSQALDRAVRLQMVPVNVCKSVDPPTYRKGTADVWSTEEAMRFMAAAEAHSLAPLWHLLLLEGMRRGEALGLRWQDISWERGTAHISQTVRAGIAKGEAIIQPRTKTSAGARTVKLTARTVAALKAHEDRQRFRERPDTWQDHDLIICTSKGTPVNPTNITRHFDRIVKDAGLRRITPHGLRHTHATMLLRQGVPAKIVSERLGHANIGVTLDVYSHVLPDMQDTAADAMDALMRAKESTA